MTRRELDTVVLQRDVPEFTLRRGDVGTVVFVYSPSTVEVEFLLQTGETGAVITVSCDNVRPVSDDLSAVTRRAPTP